jgi:hypothetical protein
MDWEAAQINIVGVGIGGKAAAQVVTATEIDQQYTDPTLMASRWFLGAQLTTAATGPGFIGHGLIRWDDLNDTAPVGAEVPGVLSDANLDWINRFVTPIFAGQGGAGTGVAGVFWDNTHLSKAKRRLGTSGTILYCVEVNGGGAAVVSFGADVRLLIKE